MNNNMNFDGYGYPDMNLLSNIFMHDNKQKHDMNINNMNNDMMGQNKNLAGNTIKGIGIALVIIGLIVGVCVGIISKVGNGVATGITVTTGASVAFEASGVLIVTVLFEIGISIIAGAQPNVVKMTIKVNKSANTLFMFFKSYNSLILTIIVY